MSSSRCEVPPEVLKKVHPDLFQNEILCVGQREDGRGSTGIRPYSFCIDMFPDCCGSASVRFGGTCFVAAVKAYVSVAKEDTTITGSIGVTVDLPAICGADFEDIAGPHSQTSSSLATLLKDFISSESVIDLQQLCIEEGKAGWHLHVSVMCLEFDGNGLDVALAAAVTALEAARVETALKYDKRFKTWRLPTIEESKKKKVVLKARPLTCTFAAVGTGKSRSSRGGGGPGGSNQSDQWRWLADPSAAEERSGSLMTMLRVGPFVSVLSSGLGTGNSLLIPSALQGKGGSASGLDICGPVKCLRKSAIRILDEIELEMDRVNLEGQSNEREEVGL